MPDYDGSFEAMASKHATGNLLVQAAALATAEGTGRNEALRGILAAVGHTCDHTIDFRDVWGRDTQRNCAKPPAYLFASRLASMPHRFYCAFHANRVYLNKPALPGWVLGVVDLRKEEGS